MNPFVAVLKREFRRLLERPSQVILIVAAPLLVSLLVGYLYAGAVLRNVPVALVDADHTAISRSLVRAVDASAALRVVATLPDEAAVKEAFLRGEIEGALLIPRGLQADLSHGRTASVVVLRNSAGVLTGKTVMRETATIIGTFSAGATVRRLQARGLSRDAALALAQPIRLDIQTLYNPAVSYLNFLPPGIWTMILQMTVMISASVVISTEYQEGTFDSLIETGNGSAVAILIGKSLPYLILNAIVVLVTMGVLFPLFGVPIHGSLWAATGLFLLFIAASFFPALFVSSLLTKPVIAAEAMVFYTAPAFVFSGYTFPIAAMPPFQRFYALLIPYTHFLKGFVRIFQAGAPAASVWPEAAVLAGGFLLPGLIGTTIVLRYRTRIARSRSEVAA